MTRQQIVFTIMLLISSRAYAMPQDIVLLGETTLPWPTTTTRTTATTETVTQPSIVWTTVALPSNYFECLHNCQVCIEKLSFIKIAKNDGHSCICIIYFCRQFRRMHQCAVQMV
ncbi:hypothetical protein TSAR_011785 [Trichomalopsis sarcophagae]|uniref:Uncharacterized protein n=1 Tax=Trichomalopsis sarcophagae TaxID=543379 RepID=A0A232F771_9HYME|nr:hypothetical protein TSAR_011785 [Trichomalopsis sarcophagae]